jgi:hypothetical protein
VEKIKNLFCLSYVKLADDADSSTGKFKATHQRENLKNFLGGVVAVKIMSVWRGIETDPKTEIVCLEKRYPFLIKQNPVALDAVPKYDPVLFTFLFLSGDNGTIEFFTGKQWFSSMPAEFDPIESSRTIFYESRNFPEWYSLNVLSRSRHIAIVAIYITARAG